MIKKYRIQLFFVLIFTSLLAIGFLSNTTLRVLFPTKLRAHKVNTIEKMLEAREVFSGLELDVVYHADKNYFEVNHPPDSSIHLTLANYLQKNSENKNCNYWLDFKNLDSNNAMKSSISLDSLTQSYSLQNSNFIVESMNPNCLSGFKAKGFQTAYYLPSDLYLKSEEELKAQINSIKIKLAQSKTTYISFDYRDYSLVKKYFPDEKKIAWFTVYGKTNKFLARLLLFKIAFDEKVDVLLVPYKAASGNR